MRVLIAGNVHDPLSPAQEKDVRQFNAQESVQGVVLPAPVAAPADLPVVFAAAVFCVGALGAFFAFMVWRRTRSWQQDLPRCLAGMAPAGTAIGVDAAGVAVGAQIFPWRDRAASSCSIRP